ncbi:MBL fold metallo-hydrolase [Comamonas endophytica]|uniref:MBL fold metallo-hydrolase n=1 Tax=Comamonas endophytica TaxID=2949090 RepID=A0ABY6GE74_9BURK|nr:MULTISPECIES: MBL fold metallo-hydrolase [unclassified Acidovorax]MCD2513002.1 MBL fold metallo-hydrolase [Acidovorax sp. D4N7]UYG52657.1 MBL fold metallo-hydrolase [Acidovorax sp. 5MLIR]
MPRIHHLNCICACPLGGRLMDGRAPTVFQRGTLCCHCLLLETSEGLTLVDTGYGLGDVREPQRRLSSFFLWLMSPDLREEMTAARQIERLGFRREDVRHIVLTHLDFDHAGGLDDFPRAAVHLLRSEREAAEAQHTWLDRQRYRPAQWASRPRWQVYDAAQGDTWQGLQCVRALRGLTDDVLLVPLAGHTLGHAGVAVRSGEGWMLMAGDAYFHHREMDLEDPWCTPGLRMYQTMMEKDRKARLANQGRLRALKAQAGAAIDILSAHDPLEFERVAGRAMYTLPEAVPAVQRT